MNRQVIAYLQLAAAMTIVGSSVAAGKLIVATIPPFIAGAGRFILASLLLVPLAYSLRQTPQHLPRRDWAILLLQAFAGIFLFNVFLLYGLRLTTATTAGVIIGTTPAVTALFGALIFREQARPLQWLGIGLAACGAIIANLPTATAGTTASAPFVGTMLVLGAVCGEACFALASKALAGRSTPLFNATAVSVFGLCFFLPPALNEARTFAFTTVPFSSWLIVAYTGVVVTVLAFILWFSGVQHVSASVAAGFTGVLPTSALLFSALLLGEPLTRLHLLSISCVLLGLACLTYQPH